MTDRLSRVAAPIALLLCSTALLEPRAVVQAQAPSTAEARIYCVDPDSWQSASGWNKSATCWYPEQVDLGTRASVGVTFSGGGTRSASASLGAMRGLVANGWLDRIGYFSAVSGGGWAAVPFVYSTRTDRDVLGEHAPCAVVTLPKDKTLARDRKEIRCGPLGFLGEAIASSSVLRCGLEYFASTQGIPDTVNAVIRSLGVRCAAGGTRDRTFAEILGDIFLGKELCNNCGRGFIGQNAFPDSRRPFVIAGGALLQRSPSTQRFQVRPFEVTPRYAGVPQQFGRIGGSFVESWAYGRFPLAIATSPDRITVRSNDTVGIMLQDALAITGSAPYLATLLLPPQFEVASEFFPVAPHWSFRGGSMTTFTAGMSHGDGGFADFTGIMALLARQVRNILVIEVSNGPAANDTGLRSLFHPIDGLTITGDKSRNVVFSADKYQKVLDALSAESRVGPAVACFKKWQVLKNRFYNIRQSGEELNICFVYNDKTGPWRGSQSSDVQKYMTDHKSEFDHFPWYATFEEQPPRVIDLTPSQVAALAALTEWQLTAAKKRIGDALGLPSQ